MGRDFLKGAEGDAANVLLAADGCNVCLLLVWLAALWRLFIIPILAAGTTFAERIRC
jgi:hypothetical protein